MDWTCIAQSYTGSQTAQELNSWAPLQQVLRKSQPPQLLRDVSRRNHLRRLKAHKTDVLFSWRWCRGIAQTFTLDKEETQNYENRLEELKATLGSSNWTQLNLYRQIHTLSGPVFNKRTFLLSLWRVMKQPHVSAASGVAISCLSTAEALKELNEFTETQNGSFLWLSE